MAWANRPKVDGERFDMNGGAASAFSGIVVIDPAGIVFDVLRSLDLDVPLRRVMSTEALRPDHNWLVVVAVHDHPALESVVYRAHQLRTVLVAIAADGAAARRAVASGTLGNVDANLPLDALRRSIVGLRHGEPVRYQHVYGAEARDERAQEVEGSEPRGRGGHDVDALSVLMQISCGRLSSSHGAVR